MTSARADKRPAEGPAATVTPHVGLATTLQRCGDGACSCAADRGSDQALSAHMALRDSAGQPLDATVARDMGAALGHSFADVQVHTDARASRAATAIGAEAFTIGRDVAFAAGRYAPDSLPGIRLLAHELTHVVQQGGRGDPGAQAHLAMSDPGDAGEREADAVADAVATGMPVRRIGASLAGVQRACGPDALGTPSPDCALSDVGVSGWQFLFATNCDELLPGEEAKLGRFKPGATLHIHGFASEEGPPAFNGDLSCHRAQRVAELTGALRPDCSVATVARHGASPVRAPGVAADPNPRAFWRSVIVQEAPPRPVAAPKPLTVVVIGSPSPEQRYQLQFATAAECMGHDAQTVWIVEKTGYELYGVPLDYFLRSAPSGGMIWLTPGRSLADVLNRFPDGSIGRLVVFSHGVPGLVALRYGWGSTAPDYGLSIPDTARLLGATFTTDADIEFNSCNTGSPNGDGENVAQDVAERVGHPVRAWTGRTSYSGINKGTCSIGPSEVTGVREFFAEKVWSRWIKDRVPRLEWFNPPP